MTETLQTEIRTVETLKIGGTIFQISMLGENTEFETAMYVQIYKMKIFTGFYDKLTDRLALDVELWKNEEETRIAVRNLMRVMGNMEPTENMN